MWPQYDRKLRERKSKMVAGNDVTNPRWPEVTSQIQNGSNPHNPQWDQTVSWGSGKNAQAQTWSKWYAIHVWKCLAKTSERWCSISNSFQWISSKFYRDVMDIIANPLSRNQTEMNTTSWTNVWSKSPLAQVGQKQCDYVYMNILV